MWAIAYQTPATIIESVTKAAKVGQNANIKDACMKLTTARNSNNAPTVRVPTR
jgi:hypothetical protein